MDLEGLTRSNQQAHLREAASRIDVVVRPGPTSLQYVITGWERKDAGDLHVPIRELIENIDGFLTAELGAERREAAHGRAWFASVAAAADNDSQDEQ